MQPSVRNGEDTSQVRLAEAGEVRSKWAAVGRNGKFEKVKTKLSLKPDPNRNTGTTSRYPDTEEEEDRTINTLRANYTAPHRREQSTGENNQLQVNKRGQSRKLTFKVKQSQIMLRHEHDTNEEEEAGDEDTQKAREARHERGNRERLGRLY